MWDIFRKKRAEGEVASWKNKRAGIKGGHSCLEPEEELYIVSGWLSVKESKD